MGRTGIEGMLEMLPQERALEWHLQSNHYPPVPAKMIPVCQKAIDRINAGTPRKRIKLPQGVSFRGSSLVYPWDVVESLHLESFIEREEW